MYSRQQIDQVRSSIDIVETIREYVPSLKVAGRSVKGLCPFHGERTPSFHVQPDKGLYKCFGCGEGGDVFAFLSKVENLTFSEAVERLASRAGVTLKREKSRDNDRQPEGTREKVLRVLEAAAAYYEEKLWGDRGGETALAYLEERHVTEDTTRAFRLGYAPVTGEPAFEALVKKGFAIEVCQQAGLASRSNAGRFYDPLYGRLIFPILDTFGNVVGFGGRLLPKTRKTVLDVGKEESGDEGPKYINSPETPVFSKGKLMYGLFQAKNRIREHKRAMVMEGYMDVIGAHQAGFDFAVATLGTALTRDHAKLLKRYADDVLMFFDADEAGRKAAVKGLEPVIQEELFPKVVLTEETGDPDEIIHEKGAGFFSHLLENAPDFVDYLLRSGAGLGSLQEKAALAKHVLQLIGSASNEILRAEWTRRLGLGLGIDVNVLQRELQSAAAKTKEAPKPAVPLRSQLFLPSAEEEYLQLLLNVPGAETWERLGAEDFADERHRRLLTLIEKQFAAHRKVSAAELYNEVSEADREWFMKVAMEDKVFSEPEDRREQLGRAIRLKKVHKRFSDLGERIKVGKGNTQEVQEFMELSRRIKGKVQ